MILKKSNLILILFSIVFFSMEFMGETYCGSLCIRHVTILGMLVFVIFRFNKLLTLMRQEHLFSFYILLFYYFWVAALGVFNGLYNDKFGPTLVVARFFPFIICFLFMLYLLKDRQNIQKCSKIIFFVLIIDAAVSILQGLNVNLGWQIRNLFFSDNTMWEIMEERDNSIGCSVVSGLFPYSVQNGYFLSSYGCLVFLFQDKEKSLVLKIFTFVCITIVILALFFTQQRMAMYLYLLACTYMIWKFNKKIFFILVPIIFCWIALWGDGMYDMGRFKNTNDTGRLMMFDEFFSFFPDHLFFGDRSEYVALYLMTPHSLFMESFLLGGFLGVVLIMIFFIYLVFHSVRILLKNINVDVTVCAISVLSFLLIGFTHSSGFHTGYTMIIPAYVFMVLELRQENKEEQT